MRNKKSWLLAILVVIVAFFLIRSCSRSSALCGKEEGDLMRSACEKSLTSEPKG